MPRFWGILLGVVFAVVVSAAPAPETAVPEDVRPPEVVLHEVEDAAVDTESWVVREKRDFLHFIFGGGASVLIGAAWLWCWRRYFRRRGRRSWKVELIKSLVPPLTALAVLSACFIFSRPLLRSLPRRFGVLDLRLFYAALTLIAAWGMLSAVAVLDKSIRRFAARNDNALDDLTVGMIGTTLKIAIAVTVVLFIGQSIFDLNITALLAGAGVVGLAVALAAKETLSNFFGTLVIVADSPFRLGDRIVAGGVDGIVEHVGMRSSRIRTADESVCTIPNSMLTNTVVQRISPRGLLKHTLTLGLVYQTSPEQIELAMKILHEIMDDFHGADAVGYAPRITFAGFGASSVDLRAVIWLKAVSFAAEEILLDELHLKIFRRFGAAGLSFAYPTRTLFIAGEGASAPR